MPASISSPWGKKQSRPPTGQKQGGVQQRLSDKGHLLYGTGTTCPGQISCPEKRTGQQKPVETVKALLPVYPKSSRSEAAAWLCRTCKTGKAIQNKRESHNKLPVSEKRGKNRSVLRQGLVSRKFISPMLDVQMLWIGFIHLPDSCGGQAFMLFDNMIVRC